MSASVPARAPRPSGLENLAVVSVAGLLLIGVLVWAAGELAGLLFAGGRPRVTFAEIGEIVVRLVKSPFDPAAAWPKPQRAFIPGPLAYYSTLVTLVALTALLVKRLIGLYDAPRSERSSSWATRRDLGALIVKRPVPGRLTLGRVGRDLVAAEKRQSVIVLGPTQSMKTSGFAIPAILEWQGPVLATSVKTDLVRHTESTRRERGEVFVYDPTACTGLDRHHWSPLMSCKDWHGAQRTASWLTGATTSRSTGLADADFWYAAAAKLLAPLLLAASNSERTMSDVVRWVNLQEEKQVIEALTAAGEGAALDAAMASFRRDNRQRSSVYTTAETVLAAYEDPEVARSAERCDISPEALLNSDATLYVTAPSHEQRRLRPLFETLLHTILSAAFERASANGGELEKPLLVVLDEAANIAPLRDLDSLASTAAGHGIQLVSVFQDLAQVSARYGDRAQTVVNNHRAKIVLSGVSDNATLEYASLLLGDEEILQASVTRGSRGSTSTTESTGMRSLAPAHVLRGIRPGEGVLVYGHLPPARLQLRPWFQMSKLDR